jgi:hypothetical protein
MGKGKMWFEKLIFREVTGHASGAPAVGGLAV